MAYADWCGLRPMTELEFEKACRGNAAPVAGEMAWGSTDVTVATGITGGGTASETASNPGANCVAESHLAGPMRVGCLATASTDREGAGASLWGMMDLSGNLWERTVSAGHATGRQFNGIHGNGVLTTMGYADVSKWPGITAAGSGRRGGAWKHTTVPARVSDRYDAAFYNGVRHTEFGFRAVRTAP
jgi:formylglycine-generating enzyme required for sulfatase activity